jgi:O-6-methylguanine DNA methyltransferase
MASFQDKVFEIVNKIPKGKVMAYSAVARAAGAPRAWRAVGNILAKNKDLKVPCHRVIRSDGKIGGYRLGANKKITRLKKEGLLIKNQKMTGSSIF